MANPPKIDGDLSDACWLALPSSSGFSDETTGALVKDDTTVWIGYDDRELYVAVYCHDAVPNRIVARETKRGTSFRGEDRIRFRLNPYNTKQGADESEINVNALGTQYAEFAGGHTNKLEWEGAWDSSARIVSDGWTCELAIPWRNFVRPNTNGKPIVMGVNFERYQARADVYSYWSNLGPQERRDLGGQWVGLVLPPPEKVNPLSMLGYIYGGIDGDRAVQRQGLDARYQFTPSLAGGATLNPDFSNVEGAVTSIDFSYAERLPDETRPFFLEGGDYYSWGMSGVTPFASVRVPAFDAGGKFYGRVGQATDIGLMTTENFGDRNDSIAYIKQTLSPYDSVALTAVSRADPYVRNQVVAGKARLARGDWTLNVGAAHSFDHGPVGDDDLTIRETRGGAGTVSLSWDRKAWSAGATILTVGRDFTARDGYVPFADERGCSVGASYNTQWRSGRIRELGIDLGYVNYQHQDRSFFRDGLDAHIDFRTEKQFAFYADYSLGRFEANHDHLSHAGFTYPSLNKFQNYGLDLQWGVQDGASYTSIGPQVTWRFFDRLSVSAATEIVHLRGAARQDVVSISYDIRRDMGVGGRLVRRNSRTNGYLSFRKSGYGGTETFVILGDPNADTMSRRLVCKVVRAL